MARTPPRPAPSLADMEAARRRSALYGLDPIASAVPHLGAPRPAGDALRQLSEPVLDELLWQIEDSSLAVILADRDGRITRRDAPTASTMATMDEKSVDVGFSLAETDVGTNGVGTSLETRRPAMVVGSDHYLETFHGFTCANAPIVHPITHRVEGTVGVLSPVDDTSPLLLSTALQLAAQITDLLLDQATPEERFLLQQFLRHRRQTNDAIATIGEGVLIATPAAQRLLVGVDHAELWERIGSVSRSDGNAGIEIDFERPLGPSLRLSCAPLYNGGELGGATVHFAKPSTAPRTRVATNESLGDLVGSSAAWQSVAGAANRAAPLDDPILIVGERGTGKLSVATAIAAQDPARPYRIFDGATLLLEGRQPWLVAVSNALGEGATAIIRHVDVLPDDVAAALASLVAGVSTPSRVIGTAEAGTPASAGRTSLKDQLDVLRIEVPPLRDRREDIAPLAKHFGAALGYHDLHPQVLSILYRQPWPGNVTDLRQAMRATHANSGGAPLGVEHLPQRITWRPSRRPLHGLRQQEAEAIIAAIRSTATRTEAAKQLGISRATLYRRIEAYGLEEIGH